MKNDPKKQLRDHWARVLRTIKGREVMLIHRDTGMGFGGFYIKDYELHSLNGEFEIILLTKNDHQSRITINEDNPWLVLGEN